MAKKTNKTEEVAAFKDAATTPVESVQEQIVDTAVNESQQQGIDEAKAQQEAEAKAQQEADAKAKEEADAKAKEEADAKAKKEADAKAKEEADAKAKKEADAEAQAIGVYKHKGINYQFVEETPEKLQTDEGLFTQEEILLNHELMQSLIDSNCIFITQV